MSAKERSQSPSRRWEQSMIDAFYDYRWHQVLDPLYEKFKHWEAGELDHAVMDQAIHQTHRLTQELYGIFNLNHEILARSIQLNEDWFHSWLKDHPPPGAVNDN
jgi:hypothetical protein